MQIVYCRPSSLSHKWSYFQPGYYVFIIVHFVYFASLATKFHKIYSFWNINVAVVKFYAADGSRVCPRNVLYTENYTERPYSKSLTNIRFRSVTPFLLPNYCCGNSGVYCTSTETSSIAIYIPHPELICNACSTRMRIIFYCFLLGVRRNQYKQLRYTDHGSIFLLSRKQPVTIMNSLGRPVAIICR